MKYLYIDTSSAYLYTGIVEDNNLLIEKKEFLEHNLSKESLFIVSKMFEEANIKVDDIDKILVVTGPGSFTGIRVGLTFAKVYAWAKNIPIIGVSSLEAMAVSSDINTNKVPMLNARRECVYTAVYSKDNEEIFEPKHRKLSDFNKQLEKLDNYQIISNDEEITMDKIPYNPNILEIVNHFKDREETNPHELNPTYLKNTAAEEALNDSRDNEE